MSNKYSKTPAVRGTTKKLRQLYKDLLEAGYTHPTILEMSVREALLARYGTPQEVDRVHGVGTYWGVQQPYKAKNGWRHLWSKVRAERRASFFVAREHALEGLRDALEFCRILGITEGEIHKVVNATNGRVSPWKPPYAA